jgi:hypothetical protein
MIYDESNNARNSDNSMQIALSPLYNDNEVEEIKRNYSIQNTILAKHNEELQMKITNLEKQLFHTQKQLLNLKNEKIQFIDKLKLNSKRFNDLIIDGFDRMMNEYRNFMLDVEIDVEKKDLPIRLIDKVSDARQIKDPNEFEFDHYWKNVNKDLQRRKSFIFKSNAEIEKIQTDDDEQLDTLVEKAELEEEKLLEPEYQDEKSLHIPQKRQSTKIMNNIDRHIMDVVPFLGVEFKRDETLVDNNKNNNSNTDDSNNNNNNNNKTDNNTNNDISDNNNISAIINNNDHDLFNAEMDMELESPAKSKIALESDKDNKQDSNLKTKLFEDDLEKKKHSVTKRRRSKIPRELKNLDTEKTKKWLGMDPLDDVEESTGERRKSRRRSLVVNYQLPILKQQYNRRASGRFTPSVYIDVDKENRVSKPVKKGVLKDITNITSNRSRNNENRKIKGSIFDLENQDIFGDYETGINRL